VLSDCRRKKARL